MSDYQVGQLYEPANRPYPRGFQANGQGTPVTNFVQPSIVYPNNVAPDFYAANTNPTAYNERASMFTAGCAHCFRSWELIQTAVGGAPAMLICCPLCGYVQSILQPPSLALDVNQNPNIYG